LKGITLFTTVGWVQARLPTFKNILHFKYVIYFGDRL